MAFDFHAAAVDDAVEAERERCLALLSFWKHWTIQFPEDTGVYFTTEKAIRKGWTTEQLEAELRK